MTNQDNRFDDLHQRIAALEAQLAGVKADLGRLQSGAARPPAAAVAPPLAAPTAAPAPRPPRKTPAEIELLVGGNILGKLGLAAIVVAIAWFVKFAIDNAWLGESARVGLAILGGTAIAAWGLHLERRRLRVLPDSIFGAGLAALYIACFGAYRFYGLIGITEAFLGLALLSACAALLSWASGRQLMYVFSLLGALLAPLLLSRGENSYRFLFAYLTLINAGFFVISFQRAWRVSAYLLWAGNLLVFGSWAALRLETSNPWIALAYLTVTFALLATRELLLAARVTGRVSLADQLLLGLLFLSYGGAGLVTLYMHHPDLTPHFSIALAGLALGGAWLFERRAERSLAPDAALASRRGVRGALLIAWTLALFFALTDYSEGRWLSLAWVGFAGYLSLAAATSRSYPALFVGLLFWFIALFRLFFLEERPAGYWPVLNFRFFLFATAAALLAGTYWIQRREPLHFTLRAFAYGAIATLVIGSLYEAHDSVHNAHYRNLSYSYVLAGYAAVLIGLGVYRSSQSLRYCGIAAACIVVVKLYLYDIWQEDLLVRIIAGFSLGLGLIIVSVVYQKYRNRMNPDSASGGNAT